MANLDLGKPHGVMLPAAKRMFLGSQPFVSLPVTVKPFPGGRMTLPPAHVVVFTY